MDYLDEQVSGKNYIDSLNSIYCPSRRHRPARPQGVGHAQSDSVLQETAATLNADEATVAQVKFGHSG